MSLYKIIFAVFGFLLVCFMSAPRVCAQVFDATALRQPTNLGMTWLASSGDDVAYARADYDDSQWLKVDPTLPLKVYFQNSKPTVVWYRLHVKVNPQQLGLGLVEWNLSSAFEIYVNGQKLISSGEVAPYEPSTFNAHLMARIPDEALKTGSLVIAMRMYISQNDWLNTFPGFYPYNLVIGQEAALHDNLWLTLIGENALNWLFITMGLGLGIIALGLFTVQREHRENLWVFLAFLVVALQKPFEIYLLLHTFPAWWAYARGCFEIAALVFQVLLFLAFVRMRVAVWIQAWLAIAMIGILYGSMQTANGIGTSASVFLASFPELSMIAGMIPVLLLVHWRKGNHEAGILLIPAIVNSLTVYLRLAVFVVSTIPDLAVPASRFEEAVLNWRVGPFTIDAGSFVGCLYVLSLGLILVLRSTRIAEQKANLEAELVAAREVQRILVPEKIESVPGFEVEAAYEPAQQVGGDFFQVVPLGGGSLLLVVGDVAGKGLPAAMLVGVLVGAIRAVGEHNERPAQLLASLNQRLVASVGANYATALAVRLDPDGTAELSNAGHLAPYLDGQEIDVPGALPLGANAGTQYETLRFRLESGSRLTFCSDGIVEAQNVSGQMFGFDRSCGVSTEPVGKIIEMAKRYGQHDDMTVIAITRTAVSQKTAKEKAKKRTGQSIEATAEELVDALSAAAEQEIDQETVETHVVEAADVAAEDAVGETAVRNLESPAEATSRAFTEETADTAVQELFRVLAKDAAGTTAEEPIHASDNATVEATTKAFTDETADAAVQDLFKVLSRDTTEMPAQETVGSIAEQSAQDAPRESAEESFKPPLGESDWNVDELVQKLRNLTR